MNGKWVSRIVAAVLFLSVFGLMGLVIYRDRAQILAFHWRLDPVYLLLASLVYSATLFLLFTAWQWILRAMNGYYDVRNNFRIYYLCLLARRLPSMVWYVAGRIYLYKRVGVAESAVVGGTTIESLAVALAGVISYLLLLPLYPFGRALGLVPITLGGIMLLLVLSQPQFVIGIINRLFVFLKREPIRLSVRRRDIARWLAVYVAGWLVGGLGLFFMIKAIYNLPWSALPGIVGIATLTTLISLLLSFIPGGSSLKELGLSALLTYYVPLSVGVMIAIAYRVWLTLLDIAWALFAAQFRERQSLDFPVQTRANPESPGN